MADTPAGTMTFRLSVDLGLYMLGKRYIYAKRGGLWRAKTAGGESAREKQKTEKKIRGVPISVERHRIFRVES